jgi:ADP-ribose pyrophosphatase YjhB (NUDIX family)
MNWEQFAVKVMSISKIGLKFSKDEYALENYEELERISREMLNSLPIEPIAINLYERDLYPTPNVSVRVLLFDDEGRLLLVKEKVEDKWAVPGGWCDVFESPKENGIKEVKQESGFDVEIDRLVGVFQREKYKDYPTLVSEYVHYFVGHIVNGVALHNHETTDVAFFAIDHLPELSKKSTRLEIGRALQVALYGGDAAFD